jgi:hypothetical protein
MCIAVAGMSQLVQSLFCWLGDQGIGFQFAVRIRDVSIIQNAQIDSEADPHLYPESSENFRP